MKSMEMDFSAADGNDYIHTDRNLQFKRERRKVGKILKHFIYKKIILQYTTVHNLFLVLLWPAGLAGQLQYTVVFKIKLLS